MSYIGSTPTSQAFVPGTDTFSGTGSQTAFTLSRNVSTVNDILVVVNNVEQQPSNYTVAGTTLTFSPAPSSGTNNIYVRYLSTNLLTIVPSQASVGLSQLSATGTPSSTTFHRGDNTWAAPSGLGDGQTWTNVTGSRALSTTYTNSTGKPIFLSVLISNGAGGAASLYVNSLQVSYNGTTTVGNTIPLSSIVPAGGTYYATSSGSISGWYELR